MSKLKTHNTLGKDIDCLDPIIPNKLSEVPWGAANYQAVSKKHSYGPKQLRNILGIDLWRFERERKQKKRERFLIRIIKIAISFELAMLAWYIYSAN